MPEYSNYLESLDPVVGALSGDEIMGASKDGDAVSLTAQQIADLGGGGAVDSVNGQTGVVVLDASDVGADPSGTAAGLIATEVTNRNAAIAAATVGLWDDRGTFSAAGGAYPSSGGSGTAGAILKGDIWTISTGGTLPTGQVVEVGDTVRALIDTPGNTQANWGILQNNIGFVPENVANKATDFSVINDTKYPTVKAVNDQIDSDFFYVSSFRSLYNY